MKLDTFYAIGLVFALAFIVLYILMVIWMLCVTAYDKIKGDRDNGF